jgi:phage terminase large subunit-like protein
LTTDGKFTEDTSPEQILQELTQQAQDDGWYDTQPQFVERMVNQKGMTRQEAESMAAEFFKSLKEMTTVKR